MSLLTTLYELGNDMWYVGTKRTKNNVFDMSPKEQNIADVLDDLKYVRISCKAASLESKNSEQIKKRRSKRLCTSKK